MLPSSDCITQRFNPKHPTHISPSSKCCPHYYNNVGLSISQKTLDTTLFTIPIRRDFTCLFEYSPQPQPQMMMILQWIGDIHQKLPRYRAHLPHLHSNDTNTTSSSPLATLIRVHCLDCYPLPLVSICRYICMSVNNTTHWIRSPDSGPGLTDWLISHCRMSRWQSHSYWLVANTSAAWWGITFIKRNEHGMNYNLPLFKEETSKWPIYDTGLTLLPVFYTP